MAELIVVLEYIHCKGIAQHDFKIDNILLDRDGHLVITDFGVAFDKENCGRNNNVNNDWADCKDESHFKKALNHDVIMVGNIMKIMLGVFGSYNNVKYGVWPILLNKDIRMLDKSDFFFQKLNESKNFFLPLANFKLFLEKEKRKNEINKTSQTVNKRYHRFEITKDAETVLLIFERHFNGFVNQTFYHSNFLLPSADKF